MRNLTRQRMLACKLLRRLYWFGLVRQKSCCAVHSRSRRCVVQQGPLACPCSRVTGANIAELHMLGNVSDFEATEFVLQPDWLMLVIIVSTSLCMLSGNSLEVASQKGRMYGVLCKMSVKRTQYLLCARNVITQTLGLSCTVYVHSRKI